MADHDPAELNVDAIASEVTAATSAVLKAASSCPSHGEVALSIGEAVAAQLAPLRLATEAIAARLDCLEQ